MRIINIPIAAVLLSTLSACGGGSSDSIQSTGLYDVPIPVGAEFDALPANGQVMVTEWANTNETGVLDTTPTSSATFSGNFLIGADGDAAEPPIFYGDAEITTNFDSSNVDGVFDNVTLTENSVDVPLTGNLAMTSGILIDGEYVGDLAGTLNEGADDYVFDGLLVGTFVEGGETIGLTAGTVTNPDLSEGDFAGYFSASE